LILFLHQQSAAFHVRCIPDIHVEDLTHRASVISSMIRSVGTL